METVEQFRERHADDPSFVAEWLALGVAEQAARVMALRGLSRSDLARKMGVSRALVTRTLNAPTNLTLRSLSHLALSLGARPIVGIEVSAEEQAQIDAMVEALVPPEAKGFRDVAQVAVRAKPMQAVHMSIATEAQAVRASFGGGLELHSGQLTPTTDETINRRGMFEGALLDSAPRHPSKARSDQLPMSATAGVSIREGDLALAS